MQLHKWPDIEQLRSVVRRVKDRSAFVGKDDNGDPIYDYTKPKPTLAFTGTTKLHGSNAACGYTADTDEVWFQSRERIITVDSDNAGFCRFWLDSTFDLKAFLKSYYDALNCTSHFVLYGEWCGGNIQKGVALNQLPKMFVIFGAKADDRWLTPSEVACIPESPAHNIYNTYQAQTWTVQVDFENPELHTNQFVDITNAVENECPWGKRFNVSGVGEGEVWVCVTQGYESSDYWFKTKGERHAGSSKVKTVVAVDVEKAKSIQEFVERAVNESRCRQSISKLVEAGVVLDRSQMGQFLRWIFNDVIKEESDTAAASGIDIQKISGQISNAAKRWFFANEDKF